MQKITVLLLIILLLGCGSSEKTEVTEKKLSVANLQPEMQQVATLLISGVYSKWKSDLFEGVTENGFEHAITVCKISAPLITKIHSLENWSIKRVTDKPRNPLNKVDDHEQQILALFADSQNKLTFFDEWTDDEPQKNYYYYQPIYMGKFCLKCHGDKTTIDEKAAITIHEKYPDDKAINYSEGDLSGMFVVCIEEGDDLLKLNGLLQDSL